MDNTMELNRLLDRYEVDEHQAARLSRLLADAQQDVDCGWGDDAGH